MELPNKKYKSEIIGIIIIAIASFILFAINKKEQNLLDEKGVYIIGKLFSSSSEGEISWVYNFQYLFNNKIYYRSFTGPLPVQIRKDSLMFFKILPEDPNVCLQLQDVLVPQCIILDNVPKEGWKKLPLNICK